MSNLIRVLKTLANEGLDVRRDGNVYHVKSGDSTAEILLPDSLPLEGKAVHQLMNLAKAKHPNEEAHVTCACATPDFHPGHPTAIGSIVSMKGQVVPGAVGTDIGCGMRLHWLDITVEEFASKRNQLVELLKGDYFYGTRDIIQSAETQRAMFSGGLIEWFLANEKDPLGRMKLTKWKQIESELDRVYLNGSLVGNTKWASDDLVPSSGHVRDPGMATIGSSNHFVELLAVDDIIDTKKAYALGLNTKAKSGMMAFMVHSGSRMMGKHVGMLWGDKAKALWPKGIIHPESGIFPVANNENIDAYIEAENTASNYAFVNRLILAELMRLRLREVFGDHIEAPLVYDLPHNITLKENGEYVVRKGACPAHEEQPVIIPGSMGSASFLLTGTGNQRWKSSASHGAGRAINRFNVERNAVNLGLEGVDCITQREERRIEEAPGAYKDIIPVIQAQVEAGMVLPVVKFRPIMTFKA